MTHLTLSSHLHKPRPLVAPCIVPELHEYVGVEAEHDDQGNHKNDQEDSSEVSFLQAFRPSTEVADTLLTNDSFTKGADTDLFQGDLEDEKARTRRDQRDYPGSGN